MTIKVKVGSNMSRTEVMVDDSSTLKSVLEAQDVNYATATLFMDGSTLKPGDVNKTFADLGVTDSCYLIATVKTANA